MNDYGEIMVQVWYPGSITRIKSRTLYGFIKLRSKTIAAAGNLPFFSQVTLTLQKQIAILRYLATTKKAACLLLFFHMDNRLQTSASTLFEHLSSQGYVVVALDHSYDCNLTIFLMEELLIIDLK